MNFVIFLALFCTVHVFNLVHCTTKADCESLSKKGCDICLNVTDCAYCKNSGVCFLYDTGSVLQPPCYPTDMNWKTCAANLKIWIIVISVLGGVAFIAIFITLCCICRKCKRRAIRKEQRRQLAQDQQMEERRAAAEARTASRGRVADHIRMKYGMLNEKENTGNYARME